MRRTELLSIAVIAVLFAACTKLKATQMTDAAVEGDGAFDPDGGVAGRAGGSANGGGRGGAGGSAAMPGGAAGTDGEAGSGGDGDAGGHAGASGSAGAGGSSGAAATAGSGGSAPPSCPPGSDGCECKSGGCDPDLACVDALCTSEFCGNGKQDGGEECDDGNAADGDACTHECKQARCGDGLVQNDVEECDDGNSSDGDSCSNACKKHYNVAFVTSTTYSVPTLGGLTGADAACQARATAGGLSGHFVAWMSDSKTPVLTRLKGARGWVRPDGKPFLDEASGQATYYPPRVTELGTVLASDDPPALGGYAEGSSGSECEDWTSTAAGNGFLHGDPTGGAGAWTGSYGDVACAAVFRIYCFQNDFQNPLTFTKASGRLAFVSNKPWTPSGGLAGADGVCGADATAAGFSGTFKAMLATTTASAASRFSTAGGVWVRPDGIPLVAQASDMFSATGVLLAPLQLTAQGNYLGNYGGWSGSADPQKPGTNTCSNWTIGTSGSKGVSGRVLFGQMPDMLAFDPDSTCDSMYTHLYCLQM
jgi:cysteine-rich repeat protein